MSFSWKSRNTSYVILLISIFVFIKNFWLNEDAYILFRSLEQLQAGNGAVWNIGERVQVYTSAAWYWLLAAVNALLNTVYTVTTLTTTITVTAALFLVLLALTRRIYRDTPSLWFLLLAFLLSKGFFDYTSSGLENILAYLALTALYGAYRTALSPDIVDSKNGGHRQYFLIAVLTGLMPLVRHDLILLCAPPLMLLLWQLRHHRRLLFFMGLLAALPLVLWTGISLVYYGLPLPNTAYAKLNHGFPTNIILEGGAIYFSANARLDPITMLFIVIAPVVALFKLQNWQRAFALGIGLYCFYLYKSGGDYMPGRFLSFPFLIAALLLADWLYRASLSRPTAWLAALIATAYLWAVPSTPPLTTWTFGRDADPWDIMREVVTTGLLKMREMHYITTLGAWWNNEQLIPCPQTGLRLDGEKLKQSDENLVVRESIGMLGYYTRLDLYIVDFYGLADPFLSHLPAVKRYARGHFERELVEGYVDHLRDGVTPIRDPKLNEYYQHIALISRSDDLFSRQRLKAIIELNLGHYEFLLDAYRRDIKNRRR